MREGLDGGVGAGVDARDPQLVDSCLQEGNRSMDERMTYRQ